MNTKKIISYAFVMSLVAIFILVSLFLSVLEIYDDHELITRMYFVMRLLIFILLLFISLFLHWVSFRMRKIIIEIIHVLLIPALVINIFFILLEIINDNLITKLFFNAPSSSYYFVMVCIVGLQSYILRKSKP